MWLPFRRESGTGRPRWPGSIWRGDSGGTLVDANGFPGVGAGGAEEVQFHRSQNFVAGEFAIVAAHECFAVAFPLGFEGDFSVLELALLDLGFAPAPRFYF